MLKKIKNDNDYEVALERLEIIFDSLPNTSEGDELEVLVLLIKEYEDRVHPVLPPDPIEVLKLTMQENGLKSKDLIPLIGSKSYVSQILNKKKPLTAEIMRMLHKTLGIPSDILLAS